MTNYQPTDPPENLPSVISPTTIPRSLQMAVILEVESSISGIPGPPTGPSKRTIIMSLFVRSSGVLSRKSSRDCSPLNTLANPVKTLFSNPPSTPANFKTALYSGDRLPPSNLNPPVGLKGFWTEYITSPSGRGGI